MSNELSSKVLLFKSLFKGREDVFAVRWEKGNKSGYMPAYLYDPYLYRIYKIKGGSFQNYPDKTYLPLTDEQIIKHFNGEQQIGIYPLLTNNTCYFLAADFDEENWVEQSIYFINLCKEKDIPAYLERSRSGNGGHVWIFFDSAYPSFKCRKIFLDLLKQAGIISVFDKTSSFDRLFPNQDYLSGKRLGNLIALPLFKKSLEKGNSCFIDPVTLEPIKSQWDYLQKIKKVSTDILEKLFQANKSTDNIDTVILSKNHLTIRLSKNILLNKNGINSTLITFLKDELNFANSEFFIKKNTGRNTYGVKRYFKFIEEKENELIIPRGFVGKLIRFCKENKIGFEFIDDRKKLQNVFFKFNATLREYQIPAIDAASKKNFGVIVAPPATGKTVIGLKIISDKQQPALIIVHRKQLLEQWAERIESFLSIPKNEIGKITAGKIKVGNKITIATVQSLSKALMKDNSNLENSFGTILVDECHHIPADTYMNVVSKLNCYYLYGLTATPFRKYNDGKIIYIYLGEKIAEINAADVNIQNRAFVIIRNTELNIPFNSATDKFEILSKALIHDTARNKLILKDIIAELDRKKKVVVITERKEHIDSLNQFLKQSYETITLSGDDTEINRKNKWEIINSGNYQVIITTGQFFGEGTDLQNVQVLFLIYPFSFEGKLIQYIGRVQRSEITPVIYDYRDIKIDYLNKLFLKRNSYYRKIQKLASLFDEEINTSDESTQTIQQTIKVPILDLDFKFGSVAFDYIATKNHSAINFEIENNNFRPEFEVLKPFIVKVLKSKNITVEIYVEFKDNELIAQSATSNDIQKINKELIETVRFKYIEKNFLKQKYFKVDEKNNDISKKDTLISDLYESEEQLLQDILKESKYKHHFNSCYLAERHANDFTKVRFMLHPFSFIFLIEGSEQYHFILETLDIEEATYLWHFEKINNNLQNILPKINSDLNLIRNKGRQFFLETNPKNFTRVLHDYSNPKESFILWKDLIEEQLA